MTIRICLSAGIRERGFRDRLSCASMCVYGAICARPVHTYTRTDTRANARPCSAGLHVREVTHVGGYLRYLWAIFPIQLLLSKPLPVQHVRNKKLDKIISTSRHGFDSLKLVKSYGAGIRGILFYFLSLRALSLSPSFFCFLPLFADAPFFVIPLSKRPMADRGIDPPRAHKSAIFVHIEGLSRFFVRDFGRFRSSV